MTQNTQPPAHSASPSAPGNDPTLRLETQSIGKLLVVFSLPAIAAMSVISLYNIIDSIFIGHGLGSMALSGLAITFPFMNLQMAVSMLAAVGGSALCSIELGRKNPAQATRILGQVCMLAVGMGCLFGIVGLIFLDPILIMFGASELTLPYARDFMQVILLGSPAVFIMLGLNHQCRASGYPNTALMSAVLSALVNVVLCYLFIYGLEWGMRGAGLATVLGQTAAAAMLVRHFSRPGTVIHFQRGIFRLQSSLVRPMLKIGLAPFLMNVCACIIVIIINIGLWKYGGDLAVGAYGIANRLLMLVAMVIVGITLGMQPIVGYNFGARQPQRVIQALRYCVIAGTLITTLGWALLQFFPEEMTRVFTDDPELIAITVNGLKLCSFMFFLVGGQIVIASYFQYIGLASVAIFLSLSRQMLFLLPCLVFFPRLYGVDGVWASLPVADVLACVVTVVILIWSLKKGHQRGVAPTTASESVADTA